MAFRSSYMRVPQEDPASGVPVATNIPMAIPKSPMTATANPMLANISPMAASTVPRGIAGRQGLQFGYFSTRGLGGLARILGFSASFMVFIGACAGLGTIFFLNSSFELVHCVAEVYLLIFGLVMLLLETPVVLNGSYRFKAHIGKFAGFLSRALGRGIFYIFLGAETMETLSALWVSAVARGVAIGCGLSAILIGVYLAFYSHVLAKRSNLLLEHVRRMREQRVLKPSYEHFAIAAPTEGLTRSEFSSMVKNFEVNIEMPRLDDVEISFLFAALSQAGHPDPLFLSLDDLLRWADDHGHFFM